MTEIIKEEKQTNQALFEALKERDGTICFQNQTILSLQEEIKTKTEVRKKSLVEVESQGEKEKAWNQDVSENLNKKDMLSGVLEEMNRHVKEEMQALKEACKKSIEEERERLDKNENLRNQKVSESLKVEGMTISIVDQKIVGLQEEQQTSREVYQSLTQLENVQSVNKDLEKMKVKADEPQISLEQKDQTREFHNLKATHIFGSSQPPVTQTTKLQNVLTDIEGTEPEPTDFLITAQEKVFT
ncbi:hypothetical protein WMY93_006238 [Mugilogobius chulae]|uniref:Uncharacterized protein n=1 Tax=Mugilogobius chulae TaxID=88201 RepID=A0AAW0PJ53_9GOBI